MKEGAIEETQIPRNPLDVLAQQIVAICADEEIEVDELHELVPAPTRSPTSRASSSRTCSTCSPAATRRTSSPSCGRGSSGTGPPASSAGAAARAGSPSRTPGRSPTAGSSASTSSTAAAASAELDEEMVYEARAGQTFMLGASTWRIEEITRDRVLVSPAPGVPGAIPFWKGEGRPAVRARRGDRQGLARAGVALGRTGGRAAQGRALARRAGAREPDHVPARAGAGDRGGPVRPDDRRRALPRRDRRLARLHPHAVRRPGARAVGARASARAAGVAGRRGARRSGRTTGSRSTCPTPTRRPRPSDVLLDPDEVEDLIMGELGGTALFGARFRENAGRALLIPRRRPGSADAALAAAAEGAEPAPGGAEVRGPSRSCSRPTASASRTSSTSRR